MRISDWSSDVCSSDLIDGANNQPVAASNIAIIHTEIWEVPQIVDSAGARAHDMRLTGTGPATIFRDGLRQQATWSRGSDTEPFPFKRSEERRGGEGWGRTCRSRWATLP